MNIFPVSALGRVVGSFADMGVIVAVIPAIFAKDPSHHLTFVKVAPNKLPPSSTYILHRLLSVLFGRSLGLRITAKFGIVEICLRGVIFIFGLSVAAPGIFVVLDPTHGPCISLVPVVQQYTRNRGCQCPLFH